MARALMSGAEGAFFEAFLRAVRVLQGRPVGEHRRGLDGVFWIARTGSASCALPEEPGAPCPRREGNWSSVRRQARRWTLAGAAGGDPGGAGRGRRAPGGRAARPAADGGAPRSCGRIGTPRGRRERGRGLCAAPGCRPLARWAHDRDRPSRRGLGPGPCGPTSRPGQASDHRGFGLVMGDERPAPAALSGDPGHDARRIRARAEARDAVPVIPKRRGRRVRTGVDRALHALRHRIERRIGRLEHRRPATRHDRREPPRPRRSRPHPPVRERCRQHGLRCLNCVGKGSRRVLGRDLIPCEQGGGHGARSHNGRKLIGRDGRGALPRSGRGRPRAGMRRRGRRPGRPAGLARRGHPTAMRADVGAVPGAVGSRAAAAGTAAWIESDEANEEVVATVHGGHGFAAAARRAWAARRGRTKLAARRLGRPARPRLTPDCREHGPGCGARLRLHALAKAPPAGAPSERHLTLSQPNGPVLHGLLLHEVRDRAHPGRGCGIGVRREP